MVLTVHGPGHPPVGDEVVVGAQSGLETSTPPRPSMVVRFLPQARRRGPPSRRAVCRKLPVLPGASASERSETGIRRGLLP